MIRATTLLLALGASLALAGCDEDPLAPEFPLTDASFAEFDLNDDALLSATEFETGFVNDGVFDFFDVDRSGFLEVDEFDPDLGAFDTFDLDSDGFLDEDEFVGGTFTAFDIGLDGFIDPVEFEAGLDLF